MAHRQTKLEKDIKQRLTLLVSKRYNNKRSGWLQPYPLALRIEALVAIQNEDWSQLQQLARKWRRGATRDLREMSAQQQQWTAVSRDVQKLREAAAASWRPPSSIPNWADVQPTLIAELEKQGYTRAQIDDGLAAFARASLDDLFGSFETPLAMISRHLDIAADARMSALAAADLAESVATFNLVCNKRPLPHEPKSGLGKTAMRDGVALLTDLHAAWQAGDRRAVARAAKTVESRAARLLKSLATSAAFYACRNTSPENALDIADAVRLGLFARMVGRVASWMSKWGEGSAQVVAWTAAAREKTFDSSFQPPAVIHIDDLLRTPQSFVGKQVTIEGSIGPVAILHRGSKVISSTSVSDRTGAVLRVGLPHFKIDSGGLVPGTFARITGVFTNTHDDFVGAVLVPERRNMTDDARVSWIDWLRLELASIAMFTPHNLTASWSWVRGVDGPGNPLRYGTWVSNQRKRSV